MKKTIFNLFMIAGITMATLGCKNENKEANTEDAQDVAVANTEAFEFTVDTTASVIEWKGEKPTGSHTGTIKLSEGVFKANDSLVESGTFVVDMKSLEVTDLEGEDKQKLESHLMGTVEGKEGDFFNVGKFPNTTFEVTGISQKDGKTMLQGNLTMTDKTNNVEFPVSISMNGDTLELTSEPFMIDRTKWGVNYGSKSVFDTLGDKFINDEIELSINLIAHKA